jgi:hypothetical protein
MRKHLLLVLIVLVSGGWFCPRGVALAEATDDDALIREGVELRRLGRNEDALERFRRAHALRATARSQAQIALAQQALGRWVEAEVDLSASLDAADDPWIARHRAILDVALRTIRDHLGTLQVECSVEGATIIVEGEVAGVATKPGRKRVLAGTTRVEVQAPGYEAAVHEIFVPAHATATLVVVLEKLADAEQSAVIAPPPAGIWQKREIDQAPPPRQWSSKVLHAEPRPVPLLSWVALGTGGALLVTGIAAHAVREYNAARYNDDATCFFGDRTRDDRCGARRDTVETAQLVSTISYSAAAAALGTAILLLLHERNADLEQKVRIDGRARGLRLSLVF